MSITDLIQPGSMEENLIIALAAFAALINSVVFYRTLLVRDGMGKRIKNLSERRDALRAGMLAPRRRARSEPGMGMVRDITRRLNLLKSREAEKASTKLMQAGWRSRDALALYVFLKLVLPIGFGIAAVLVIYILKIFDLSDGMKAVVALGAVLLGAYAPEIFVSNTRKKRQVELQNGLPDVLDLLVICAEAGQSLDAALGRVAREMSQSFPVLAEEIGLTSIELGLLPERRQALDNLNRRTDIQSIRGVVNTLLQTERYGTPLSQSLRVLAREFRHDRLMRAEAKAARLPATLTIPMIIFILPPLFVVLLGPAILKVIDMMGNL